MEKIQTSLTSGKSTSNLYEELSIFMITWQWMLVT